MPGPGAAASLLFPRQRARAREHAGGDQPHPALRPNQHSRRGRARVAAPSRPREPRRRRRRSCPCASSSWRSGRSPRRSSGPRATRGARPSCSASPGTRSTASFTSWVCREATCPILVHSSQPADSVASCAECQILVQTPVRGAFRTLSVNPACKALAPSGELASPCLAPGSRCWRWISCPSYPEPRGAAARAMLLAVGRRRPSERLLGRGDPGLRPQVRDELPDLPHRLPQAQRLRHRLPPGRLQDAEGDRGDGQGEAGQPRRARPTRSSGRMRSGRARSRARSPWPSTSRWPTSTPPRSTMTGRPRASRTTSSSPRR